MRNHACMLRVVAICQLILQQNTYFSDLRLSQGLLCSWGYSWIVCQFCCWSVQELGPPLGCYQRTQIQSLLPLVSWCTRSWVESFQRFVGCTLYIQCRAEKQTLRWQRLQNYGTSSCSCVNQKSARDAVWRFYNGTCAAWAESRSRVGYVGFDSGRR